MSMQSINIYYRNKMIYLIIKSIVYFITIISLEQIDSLIKNAL